MDFEFDVYFSKMFYMTLEFKSQYRHPVLITEF